MWTHSTGFQLRLSAVTIVVSVALALFGVLTAQAQFQVIHNSAASTGGNPYGLTIGPDGALYGGAESGGNNGEGVQFKLQQVGSNWDYIRLFDFGDLGGGAGIFGPGGALYSGGALNSILELDPPTHACPTSWCPWKQSEIYYFGGGGGAHGYVLRISIKPATCMVLLRPVEPTITV